MGRRLDDDGARGDGSKGLRVQERKMNMCCPWVPCHIGREGSTGRRGIDESRAREKAVMMRCARRGHLPGVSRHDHAPGD